MNKQIVIVIAVAAVVGAGSFYGGMKYGQSTVAAGGSTRQSRLQQFSGGAGGRGIAAGGGFAGGEIIAKDDKSVTVKLQNGGSKIIFFSGSTKIMKSAQGSVADLTVGEQISAAGSVNQDGSVTAQTIQIRPLSAGLQSNQ